MPTEVPEKMKRRDASAQLWVVAGVALFFGSLFSAPAFALYRCGNTYQDKPCASGAPESAVNPALRLPSAAQPSPAVNSGASAVSAKPAGTAASPFAGVCARIGEAAQQMVWKREGGATREKQLTDLPKIGSQTDMLKALDSVYNQRGSAPEVRAAIEAECVAEKQKQADAAAALKALTEQAGGAATPSTATAAGTPSGGNQAATTPSQVANAAAADAAGLCKRLRTQDNALRADMPSRGDAATLQSYNERKRKLEVAISEAKC